MLGLPVPRRCPRRKPGVGMCGLRLWLNPAGFKNMKKMFLPGDSPASVQVPLGIPIGNAASSTVSESAGLQSMANIRTHSQAIGWVFKVHSQTNCAQHTPAGAVKGEQHEYDLMSSCIALSCLCLPPLKSEHLKI